MKINHCIVTDRSLVTEFQMEPDQVLSPIDNTTQRACDKALKITLAHQSKKIDSDMDHNAKKM